MFEKGCGVLRRAIFFILFGVVAVALVWLLARALAPGGFTLFEALALLAFAGTVPWAALSASNGLLGFAVLMASRNPAACVLPALRRARPAMPSGHTAIIICIRSEDMAAVLPPLARLLEGLAAAGMAGHFTPWFLSDTPEGPAAQAEAAAIAGFTARYPATLYRRRAENTGFKAGNVMDFCDHHAEGAEFMLCLDADSEMTAEAVLRLVACMAAEPRLAILQQLIVGRPAGAAFPRLYQFGMRANMRVWATGQAWWQGDEGPYWGHNAIIRIAPFRAHARLEALADGSPILSHDQVEAARLHAAGWKVAMLPIEAGSLTATPPALPEFIAREARWGAGSMQYFRLFRLPGLTWMGRWQFAQAIMLFAVAPLWALVLVFALANAATGGGGADPALLALTMLAVWAALQAPKWLGFAELLLKPALAAEYGGRARVLRGAALALPFTLLLDSISACNTALVLALLPFRQGPGWAVQNRADRGVGWWDAARLFWPHTLFGVLALALLPLPAWPWALPWLAGLLLAVPFCVLTSSPRVSAALRACGLAATPEELAANPPAAPPP